VTAVNTRQQWHYDTVSSTPTTFTRLVIDTNSINLSNSYLTAPYREQRVLSLSLPEYKRLGYNSLQMDVGDSFPANSLPPSQHFHHYH